MIKQKIGGRTVNTVNATGTSADILILVGLLEGEITTFAKKFEGGTTAVAPTVLNTKKFSVGKNTLLNGRRSASVSIPHVKVAKTFSDIEIAVIGAFDESYESASKCEYSTMFYDGQGA